MGFAVGLSDAWPPERSSTGTLDVCYVRRPSAHGPVPRSSVASFDNRMRISRDPRISYLIPMSRSSIEAIVRGMVRNAMRS